MHEDLVTFSQFSDAVYVHAPRHQHLWCFHCGCDIPRMYCLGHAGSFSLPCSCSYSPGMSSEEKGYQKVS